MANDVRLSRRGRAGNRIALHPPPSSPRNLESRDGAGRGGQGRTRRRMRKKMMIMMIVG